MYYTHSGYQTSIFGKICAYYIQIFTVAMFQQQQLSFSNSTVITSLHGMQMRSSNEKSVCLSLCVKRVHCDKTEESYV